MFLSLRSGHEGKKGKTLLRFLNQILDLLPHQKFRPGIRSSERLTKFLQRKSEKWTELKFSLHTSTTKKSGFVPKRFVKIGLMLRLSALK